MVNVSWHDALAYCRWLSDQTGKLITLPSEAEWEKAARGTDARKYPWGDRLDARLCNVWQSGVGDTTPVDLYPSGASPYGCLDMAGNVWEWTRSLYSYGYPYDPSDATRENVDAPNNQWRVLRGGSWNTSGEDARCAYRLRCLPDLRLRVVGFRVALRASPVR